MLSNLGFLPKGQCSQICDCLNLWLETYGLEPDALTQSERLLVGFY